MNATQGVRAVLEAKAAALVTRSHEMLERLIDPQFLYVNSRGNKFSKEEYIAAYCRSGALKFLSQRPSDIEVMDYGGFAIASLVIEDHIEQQNGERSSGHYRSLCVFRLDGDRWLWVAGQTSVMA